MNRALAFTLTILLLPGCPGSPQPRNNVLDPGVTSPVTITVQSTGTATFSVAVDFGSVATNTLVAGQVFSLTRTTDAVFCDPAGASMVACGPAVTVNQQTAPMSQNLTITDTLTTLPGGMRQLSYAISTPAKVWATAVFAIPNGDIDNDNTARDCDDLNPAVRDCDNGGTCEWNAGTCSCLPQFSGPNCDQCLEGCGDGGFDAGEDAGVHDGGLADGGQGDGGRRDGGPETGDSGPPSDGGIHLSDGGIDGGLDIVNFSANTTTLTQGQSATFSAAVTDALGLSAIVGGSLESPDRTILYGTFLEGIPGSYSVVLSWDQISEASPISFTASEMLSFEAVFADTSGATADRIVALTLTCSGGAACNGVCTNLSTDSQNCSACGMACATGASCQGSRCACPGIEVVANGQCQCPAGDLLCGGSCVAESIADCGGCGVTCNAQSNASPVCTNNACGISCNTGFGNCDQTMANGCETSLLTSTTNCGTCGNACPTGASCMEGMCGCPGSEMACGTSCISVSSDPDNCGGCGVTCPGEANSSPDCVNTQCGISCAGNYGDCDGMTADGCESFLPADSANCGVCGNACPTGASCMNSACACPAGQSECDGLCVDKSTDPDNCGVCGMMCPAETQSTPVCANSACGVQCNNGYGNCDGLASDGCESNLQVDGSNCGTCGNACAIGATCSAGSCECPTGQTACGGVCRVLPDSISIVPSPPSVVVDQSIQLTATGNLDGGTTEVLTTEATWSTSNSSVAGIGAETGLLEGAAVGTATVKATYCGVVGSTIATVDPAALLSIAITPADSTLPLGTSQSLVATGTYSDGSTHVLTSVATWDSSSNAVATVTGGFVQSVATGSVTITAAFVGVTGSTSVTVDAPALVSLSISPGTAAMPLGTDEQLTATGVFTDGSMQNVTAEVVWTTGNTAIAQFTDASPGLLFSVAVGSCSVTATDGAIEATANATVEAAQLLEIAVTPSNGSMPLGGTLQLAATGTYTDGSMKALTGTVGWSSSSTPVATVSGGLVKSVTQGMVTITAAINSYGGTAEVIVGAPTLVSIAVTPAAATIALGQHEQLIANGTYSDGSVKTLTTQVIWSSDNTTIATLSSPTAGLAQSVGTGFATLTATLDGIAGSAQLTVGDAVLLSVAVTPASASTPLCSTAGGFAQLCVTTSLTATATYTDGSTQDVSSTASWSSSNASDVTVSSSGDVSGLVLGTTATVTANVGGVKGTSHVTVGAATLVSIAVTPASATVATGLTQQMVAKGTYSNGSTLVVTSTADWSTDDMNVATVSGSGLALGVTAGTANVTASLDGINGSATFTVGPPVIESIAISPASPIDLPLGETAQLSALGTYSDMTTQDLTLDVVWTSTSNTVATVSSGLVQANTLGTVIIKAAVGSVSATVTVVVLNAELVSCVVTPANSNLPVGAAKQMTATGALSDGNEEDLTNTANWTSDETTIATVSIAGNVYGVAQGTSSISATLNGVTCGTTMTVAAPGLISIAVTPANSSLAAGLSVQLTASGSYTDGSTYDLTALASWASSDAAEASVSSGASGGLVKTAAAGTVQITATLGAISGSTQVRVLASTLVSMSVSPLNDTVAAGQTVQYAATGTYTDGRTQSLTSSANWTASDNTLVTLDSSGTAGLFDTIQAGAVTITATSGSISVSTALTIGPAQLVSIAVTPGNASIALGETQQMHAVGTYTDSTTQDVTAAATWTTSLASVAKMSGTTPGLVLSDSVGKINVKATLAAGSKNVSGLTGLTITSPTLVSLNLAPANPTVALGNSIQFTATGTYTDGSTQDLSDSTSATWTSSDTVVANLDASTTGLLDTFEAGATTVSFTDGSISALAHVTVTSATLESIAVTPATSTIPLTLTQQLTATGSYSDSTTANITEQVTWTSSSSSVASVSSIGVVQSASTGTVTMTASLNEVSGTAQVTVVARELASIAITPPSATIALGASTQLQAVGTYTDGTVVNITTTANWSSSDSAVASVSVGGLVQGSEQGSVIVTASLSGVSETASIAVTAVQLTSIAIAPANASLALGTDQQLTATGTYSNGATANITTAVAWSSANAGIVSVGAATGLAAAKTVGSTTVTATLGSVAASTALTVTVATLTSIAVTPASPSIPLTETQQLTATGTYSDGSTANLTNEVVWLSTDGSVATVSMSGVVQSESTGTATVSATLEGISGDDNVTILPVELVSISVTPAAINIALGQTVQLTATGNYSDGSSVLIASGVTWTSSRTSVATLSPTTPGLLGSVGQGTAVITATASGISGTASVTVGPVALVSISLAPSGVTLPVGATRQIVATGSYSDGSTQTVTTQANWTSSAVSVASVSAGLVTAVSNGTATITATVGSVSAIAGVIVVSAQLVSIAVTPNAPSISLTESQQLTAIGTYTDGTTQNLTSTAAWTTSSSGVASVSSGGLVQSVSAGSATITATVGTIAGNDALTILPVQLKSISITPLTDTVASGQTVQYTAVGSYTDGSQTEIASSASWTSSLTGVATMNGPVATTLGQGQTIITATLNSISATANLTVGPVALLSIALTPANQSIPLGHSFVVTATGTYSDGTTQDLNATATWASTSTDVATVSMNQGTQGTVSSVGIGTSNINATVGSITQSTLVTVTPAALESIAISPLAPTIPLTESLQMGAVGTYSDGSTKNLITSVQWTSSAPSVASVTASGGLVQSLAAGATTLTASLSGVSATTVVTVIPVQLESIAITPVNQTIPEGDSVQLTATGSYSDGTHQVITGNVFWSSSRTVVAEMSASDPGLVVSTFQQGSTVITAQFGSVSATTGVSVGPVQLLSITISPASPSIALGLKVQMNATGIYSDGSQANVTSSVTWNSTDEPVAWVYSTGQVLAQGVGTTMITAVLNGITASTNVTVTPAALVSISVTPTGLSLPLTESQQLNAVGTYTDNSQHSLTAQAVWKTSNSSIASVSSSGLIQSVSPGNATITATVGQVSSTDLIHILPVQIASVTIGPVNPNIVVGQQQQLTAFATYTDGSQQGLPDSSTVVEWSSSAHGVANVETSGLAIGEGAGVAVITATVTDSVSGQMLTATDDVTVAQ